ncbi:Cof-type HAD-IIB family hydrolase [Furfurilactobacillus siliginis]|uniref:HAD superfamily hydrolase n=1 Tax=Furfurilactobacillus siliginis TaxID=348151 RepID=A0A0R2LEV9_9LACO|nr:Cof-type HAD-IIB family hydrolase [Furfurilactobacillus siliginis]KRN97127.1 HAD superfamily hydrolase [Furfurilactobacillus siliginis]GEK29595.1 haloacid dehalogenase [Furfurilactobacillus siliginis]
MSIKMIATDIDGTFIRNDHTFDEAHFNDVMTKLRQQHIRFVVASGNQLRHLTDMFQPFGSDISYVAENGGLVVTNNERIFSATLSESDVKTALHFIQNEPQLADASIVLSGVRGSYIDMHTSAKLLAGAQYFYTGLQQVGDVTKVSDAILKLDLVWNDDLAAQRAQFLNALLPDSMIATASGFGGLDIIPGHINKQVGLMELEQRWHIDPTEIVAFGDNDNDLSMMTHAGQSFAMANAAPNIQQAATHTTKWTNDQNGVLRTIDELLS